MGSLAAVMDRLEELGGTVHPTLNVYRWWRPDMALPALFHWMTPGDVERPDVPVCRLRVLERITVSIAINPSAVAGEGDMLDLEVYHDLAMPIYGAELYGRNPLGQREARMRGPLTIADDLAGASILTLEIPLEVYVDIIVPT